ncbi:MAG: hypothetical protein ACI83B_000079 [Sediminicola sp.]|jgi:hypothetical protein|tara:strand:+ start:1323 stop:1799 length:477 start_codon:yes stop_codon:yes gene_type:complete
MKKLFKLVLIFALLALVAIQFIRPDKNESGYEGVEHFENETKPTPEMASLLRANCYDCHSNQTSYPWYAEIAPVNYWLADHVNDGKKHFNVSAWNEYSVKKKDHKLEELLEMVEEGEMPLDYYTWLHGNLSENDTKQLLQWVTVARLQYKAQLEISTK